jgi:DNA polymerase-3 subunit delta'
LKFIVVDGADRVTPAGANALLKVLEETPSKVRFFLLAEQIDSVLPTVRSRCAVVSYRRLSEQMILSKLREYTQDETKALVCARIAEGSLGRALRCLVSGQLTIRDEMLAILGLTLRKDLFAAFSAVNDVTDLPQGIGFLGQLVRDVLVLDVAPGRVINVDALEGLKRLRSQTSSVVLHGLLDALKRIRSHARSSITLHFHLKAAIAAASCRGVESVG